MPKQLFIRRQKQYLPPLRVKIVKYLIKAHLSSAFIDKLSNLGRQEVARLYQYFPGTRTMNDNFTKFGLYINVYSVYCLRPWA